MRHRGDLTLATALLFPHIASCLSGDTGLENIKCFAFYSIFYMLALILSRVGRREALNIGARYASSGSGLKDKFRYREFRSGTCLAGKHVIKPQLGGTIPNPGSSWGSSVPQEENFKDCGLPCALPGCFHFYFWKKTKTGKICFHMFICISNVSPPAPNHLLSECL